jgi:hypothetical protein
VIVGIGDLAKRSAFINQEKYIGMDVRQTTISVAVMGAGGKLLMECLLDAKVATIGEFNQGLRGTQSLTSTTGLRVPGYGVYRTNRK